MFEINCCVDGTGKQHSTSYKAFLGAVFFCFR
jgi:hypothetical protein